MRKTSLLVLFLVLATNSWAETPTPFHGKPGAKVTGQIINGTDYTLWPRAEIHLVPPGGRQRYTHSVRLRKDGWFEFLGIQPGQYTVMLRDFRPVQLYKRDEDVYPIVNLIIDETTKHVHAGNFKLYISNQTPDSQLKHDGFSHVDKTELEEMEEFIDAQNNHIKWNVPFQVEEIETQQKEFIRDYPIP